MNFPEEIWERVRNMAIYFVSYTEQVDLRKLNKLYYATDKLAIENTAFPISDQDYFADDNGPVPVSINRETNIIPTFKLEEVITESSDGVFSVAPGVSFDDDEFTDEELTTLKTITEKYRTATGQEMSIETHAPGEPWDIIWQNKKGKGKTIPLAQLLEKDLPPAEKERRRLLREDAKANFESFSRLRSHIEKAKEI